MKRELTYKNEIKITIEINYESREEMINATNRIIDSLFIKNDFDLKELKIIDLGEKEE